MLWKSKGSRIARMILKKNKVGGFTLSDFKTYQKTMTITMWYWKITGQRESPEIDSHIWSIQFD